MLFWTSRTSSNFGVLQEMWSAFRDTMKRDILADDVGVPLLKEVQTVCLLNTIDQLDSFAIPSYDEDQLREWVRLARNCQAMLECLTMLCCSVLLHGTVAGDGEKTWGAPEGPDGPAAAGKSPAASSYAVPRNDEDLHI